MELIVTKAFLSYAVGDLITDPVLIASLLRDYAGDVVKIGGDTGGGGTPALESLNVLSVQAAAGGACQISGNVANASLSQGVAWSLGDGNWTQAANFLLNGSSWTCSGPTYLVAGPQLVLIVRDTANPAVTADAPAFTVTEPPGVATVAGLSGSITAAALKGALSITSSDVAGLGNAATSNFGTVSGSVADGGALAALAGEIAAGLPASQANVVSALSTGGLASVPWVATAASGTIFSHGTAPTAPFPRSGLQFGDREKLCARFNFAEQWDTEANYDSYPKLQAFLLYCQSMALAMKNSNFDANCFRMFVTAYLPRGTYLVSQPLVVPEYVNLHTDGMIVRAPYTGDQSNNGTTSVPGAFYAASLGAQGQFEPTVIIAPRAHASKLNVYVGNTNINFRGSGVAIGKTWQALVGGACTIGAAGGNYAVGDLVVLAQPSASTYWPWVAQVSAVNAAGGITAASVYETGGYGLPPALQQQQWTLANGFSVFDTANPGCFVQTKAYKADFKTPSAGLGATLAPAWTPDFGGGQYNIGAVIQTDTLIGHLNVTGFVPQIYSQTYGGTFAVLVTGLNGIIDEIEILGGNDGVYCRFANDWRITTMNCVGSGCALEVYGCGSIECPNVVFDTCGAALLINQSDRIQVRGLAFFEQNNLTAAYAFPASLVNAASQGYAGYSAIQIGQASSAAFPNAHLDIAMTLVNMGGLPAATIAAYQGSAIGTQSPRDMPYAMTLSYTLASRFDLRVTNIGEQGGAATLLPCEGFVCFGQNVDASNELRGTIDGPGIVTGPAVTLTTGHGFPACAIRIFDSVAGGWVGAGGTYDLTGSGAPTNGSTGLGKAAKGSTYRDLAGPGVYLQTGAISSPTWQQLT